jgi:rubrerythrin
MKRFICTTCGTQFAPSDVPPEQCPICQDDRQDRMGGTGH